ncbi:hypothetical protein [Arthrobacter sp. Z4-13]
MISYETRHPIFPLFLRGLQLSDARTLPVFVGAHGLDIDHLSDQLRAGARPSALYTVPDFHNPSQGTLPGEARRELVRLAEHYGFVVLADNPYRGLRFAGEQECVEELTTPIMSSTSTPPQRPWARGCG